MSRRSSSPCAAVTPITVRWGGIRRAHRGRYAVAPILRPRGSGAGGRCDAGVRPPAPPRRLPKAISIEDVERLLDAAGTDQTPRALRDRTLLEVLYGTGARISEAVALDLDDLDLDDGVARLQGGRWEASGRPLGSFAAAAVSNYLVRGPARGWPSYDAGRTPRCSSMPGEDVSAGRARGPYCGPRHVAPGLAVDVSPHTLRHSFATHLLDGGARRAGGAGTPRSRLETTTQIYTLVTVERLREVYAAAHPRAR